MSLDLSINSENSGFIPVENSTTPLNRFQNQSDSEIWQTFINGDDEAFAYIYKTYLQALFSFGCQIVKDRELVKDSIQNLFVDLSTLSEKSAHIISIKSYLFKSLYRKIIRSAKKEQKFLVFNNQWEKDGFMVDFSHERTLIDEESLNQKKTQIAKVVNQLPNRQREAFLYYFYEGLSYEEIAYIMDLNRVHSARKLIYKAIGKIKEDLSATITLASLFLLLVLFFIRP